MLQRTPEWYAARVGKLTGSRIADALARTKSGWGAGRARYRAELVSERMTGVPYPSYVSPAMKWGTDHEQDGFDAYSFARNVDLIEVGFIDHPTIAMCGVSCDRVVKPPKDMACQGLVELKCPETHTHLEFLLTEKIDGDYLKQMQLQMAVTGASWCDFVSFDPRVHLNMQLKIVRVPRDPAMIEQLEKDGVEFLKEVEAEEMALRRKYDVPIIAEAA